MPGFPKIDTPCPYKATLGTVMDGDFCRMCRRTVVDLDAMSAADRDDFLAGCEGEICVSYTVRPALAAAAIAAAAMVPTAAYAQDVPVAPPVAQVAQPVDVPEEDETMIIVVGGIKDPRHAKRIDNPADAKLPAIPVVYDDEAEAVPAPTAPVRR